VAGACHVHGPNQVLVGHVASSGPRRRWPIVPRPYIGWPAMPWWTGRRWTRTARHSMGRRPCRSPPNSADSALTSSEVPDTLKRLHIGYSQMHVSRLLAKVPSTLRSQALNRDLAATGW